MARLRWAEGNATRFEKPYSSPGNARTGRRGIRVDIWKVNIKRPSTGWGSATLGEGSEWTYGRQISSGHQQGGGVQHSERHPSGGKQQTHTRQRTPRPRRVHAPERARARRPLQDSNSHRPGGYGRRTIVGQIPTFSRGGGPPHATLAWTGPPHATSRLDRPPLLGENKKPSTLNCGSALSSQDLRRQMVC